MSVQSHPGLKGVSPPFTPTGQSALMKSTDMGGQLGKELGQAGHSGILAIYRGDRDSIASLLPPPLEPVEHTERVGLFVNQTQSGLNRHRPAGATGLDFLRTLNPRHVNWHEAFFKIPCSYNGTKAVLFTNLYVDADFKVVQGIYDGFATKLATFRETYPLPGHPLNDEMAPGGSARMTISRHEERLMTLDFEAERAVPEEELQTIIDVEEWWRVCGLRVFPDYTNPGGPDLVKQLIMWSMGSGTISRAWGGSATVSFGASEWDELGLLAPVEMLESYFVHYQYQSGPGRCSVLHDYVQDPL